MPGLLEYGETGCCLVGWKCVVDVCIATVVAPAPEVACPDLVVIVLAAEGVFCEVDVDEAPFEYGDACEVEVVEVGDVAAFWIAL